MFSSFRGPVLITGLLVLLGMLAVPPWTTHKVRLHGFVTFSQFYQQGVAPGDTSYTTEVLQYSALWNKPKSLTTADMRDGEHEPWRIDIQRLLFHLGFVILITAILVVATTRSQKELSN